MRLGFAGLRAPETPSTAGAAMLPRTAAVPARKRRRSTGGVALGALGVMQHMGLRKNARPGAEVIANAPTGQFLERRPRRRLGRLKFAPDALRRQARIAHAQSLTCMWGQECGLRRALSRYVAATLAPSKGLPAASNNRAPGQQTISPRSRNGRPASSSSGRRGNAAALR